MTRRDSSPLHALVSLLGAVFYGRRPEDARARKKAAKGAAALSATTFLVFFGYRAVEFGQEWVRHEWKVQAGLQAEMVATLKDMAKDVHQLTDHLGGGGRR